MKATIRVYIADDHAINRDGLRALLEARDDMEVVGSAENGRQAVKEVNELRPDIVIMDIAMPERNGIEATAMLRDSAPSTRVIMLSMHATTEHVFHALRAGARGYLLKNSAGAELVEAVRAVHAGKRYFSHKINDLLVEDYVREGHATSPVESLTGREREILQLIAEGHTSVEVARMLSLSPKTVETYRSRLMQKIGVEDVVGLVKFAILHGLTSVD
jgi:DNA-binding NarL/FixJ family response regulator